MAGFASASTPEERADLALAELEALGAYERSLIVVAAPTGVGYVNYSFAEALEYLTRGDCAIVVPQYALVPSVLALNQTTGRGPDADADPGGDPRPDRLDARRASGPGSMQFGESLGAQVALDVAAAGTHRFDELGLDGRPVPGHPVPDRAVGAVVRRPGRHRPARRSSAPVSQADEIPGLPRRVRHVQVIHHDDPINKFAYDAVVRAPWWMGPPETRPPLVPRETEFRPVITFVITLVDLKNGMNTKPGEFVRRGHDYRIELCEAIRLAFGLPATAEQAARIEAALREREREWATRRMVATRFAQARDAVRAQFVRWGHEADSLDLDGLTAAELVRGWVRGGS